jgi:hypothetical protein
LKEQYKSSKPRCLEEEEEEVEEAEDKTELTTLDWLENKIYQVKSQSQLGTITLDQHN